MADALEFILKVKDEASAALKAASNSIKGLGQATADATAQAAKHAKENSNLAKSTDTATAAIRNMALAFGGLYLARRAISEASDFDRAMTQIQSLTGQSAAQTKAWREELLATSAQFGKTPQEMAEGLYFISSSGIDASKAMEVLHATAMASATGLGETKDIADVVTSALNAYGQENLKAADAVGQMIEGVKLGKVEATELAHVLGQVIPNAAQAGVEFHEVNAALAAMSLSGISAARGAVMMRQTLQDVIAPSKQAQEQLKAVGLSVKQMQDVFRDQGYLKGLELLREKLGTGLEFRKVVNDAEALTGMLALTGENAGKVTQIFDALSKASGGTLTEAFQIAADSGAFKLDQGMALLNAGMIELGNQVMPIVISAISALLNLWQAFMGDTVEAHNNLQLLKIAFYLVAGAAGAWLAVMAAMKLQAMLAVIGEMAMGLYGLAASFLATGAAAAVGEEAMLAFDAALISTGIGAIVVAIGAIIVGLIYLATKSYEVSGQVVSAWDIIAAAWAGAVAFAQSVWNDISAVVVVAGRVILGVATGGLSEVVIAIAQNWDSVYQTTSAWWDAIKDYVIIAVRVIAAMATFGISELVIAIAQNWDAIWNKTKEVWNSIKDYIIWAVRTAMAIATAGLSELAIWAWNKGSEIAGRASQKAGQAFNAEIQQRGAANAAANPKPVAPPPVAPPPKINVPTPATGSVPTAGGRSKAEKQSPYEKAQADQKTRIEDLRSEISLEDQLATVLVASARARSIQTEQMKAYAQEEARIRKLRNEGKIDDKQQAQLLAQAQTYARLKGQLAGTKYDTDEAQKNFQAAESLRVLTEQTGQYVQAAGLDKKAREVRIAYLDAETAALQRGASAEQARIEGQNAAATKQQQQVRDAATVQADMFRNLNEESALNEKLAQARQLGGDAAEIQIAYVKALAEAQKAGIPDAEAYAEAMANAARRQIELARVPETAEAGMNRWMKDMADNAVSMGQIVYGSMDKLVGGMSDAMTNFVMGQKVAWGDLARSVIGYIVQMIAKMIIMKIVMAGLKMFGFADGGGFGGGDSGVTSMADNGVRFAANGMAVPKFANGGDFTNSIVRQATAFLFGKNGKQQLGVMGEAGPEAIMPMMDGGKAVIGYLNGQKVPLRLTRGPGGALGVDLSGGSKAVALGNMSRFATGGVFSGAVAAAGKEVGQGGSSNIDITVNVQTGETKTTQTGDASNTGAQLGQLVASAVQQEIIKQQRPGGLLAR